MMRQAPIRALALICLLALNLAIFPPGQKADDTAALSQSFGNASAWAGPYTLGAFVRRMVDGRIVCVEANLEQARRLKDRDPSLPLSDLAPDREQPPGLKIILRGTAQLQSFPAARDAF